MQASIQEEYAPKEQYIISDTKTKLMTINERNDIPNQVEPTGLRSKAVVLLLLTFGYCYSHCGSL